MSMISALYGNNSGGYAGLTPRTLLPSLFASRLDPIARTERIDRPDIQEYYRVRFDQVSLAGVSRPLVGPRSPIDRYLEIAAL
jgi:hypothetical protein